jgi:hypothetical protein
MILQLDPPLPLETSKGRALAHFLVDYGMETSLLWVCFLDANGQCWTVPNEEITMQKNWSVGRRNSPKQE